MLKTKTASCKQCGVQISIARSTKVFCTDACRKAANREAASGRRAEDSRVIEILVRIGYIGPIWPIFSWDESPRVYALLVPRHHALAEVNLVLEDLDLDPISEADLLRSMRRRKVVDYGDKVEAELIADFYRGRRNRRIGKPVPALGEGYTSSDKPEIEH
jgi:hypothetical protein